MLSSYWSTVELKSDVVLCISIEFGMKSDSYAVPCYFMHEPSISQVAITSSWDLGKD